MWTDQEWREWKETRLGQLQNANKRVHQTTCPKIQKVPNHLRNRKQFEKYYSPRLVSFGPIHHGNPDLEVEETLYKLMWAEMYVSKEGRSGEDLLEKILENIVDLKKLYADDVFRDLNPNAEAAWMLFVDGCSLLQIFDKFDLMKPEDLKVEVGHMGVILRDVLLLENQLPFQLLKLLSTSDKEIKEKMDHFILHGYNVHKLGELDVETRGSVWKRIKTVMDCVIDVPREIEEEDSPAHLLDYLRREVLRDIRPKGRKKKEPQPHQKWNFITYRNIQELKSARIRVKKCKSDVSTSTENIRFTSGAFSGVLEMPAIFLDDTRAHATVNMIAYEMCPDFENKHEISSYMEFLESLIDCPEDVKALRNAGVLYNGFGSDEEVANFYNIIIADLVPDNALYAPLRAKIERHYKQRHRTWFAQACHDYCRSPWTVIAVLAAFLALFLTTVQTWYAIQPSK